MQKIEFRNNTQPYINDVNLNQMQDNIEQSISESNNKIGDLSNLKTLSKDNLVNAINTVVDSETYSTSEIKTNEIWIGGKPIYKKSFKFNDNIEGSSTLTKAHNISNVDEIWVDLTNSYMLSDDGISYPMMMVLYKVYSANVPTTPFVDKTNFGIISVDVWGARWTKYITLKYTKTTD